MDNTTDFTITQNSIAVALNCSRMTVFRKLKNTPSEFRKLTTTERGPRGRAKKHYQLADVMVALRWATKNKTDLKNVEKKLIEIDAKNRKKGIQI